VCIAALSAALQKIAKTIDFSNSYGFAATPRESLRAAFL
jgi:hypothetical protein